MTLKLYKAAEVCEIAGLQLYVLRSWEKEFPGIGVQKPGDAARVYRQTDLDQVVRIKQLVLGEGLTLAGAKRRLEASAPPAPARDEMTEVLEMLGADARARIDAVRDGLRSLLEVLSNSPGATVPAMVRAERRAAAPQASRASARQRPNGPAAAARRPAVKASAPKRAPASKRAAASRKPARVAKRKRAPA